MYMESIYNNINEISESYKFVEQLSVGAFLVKDGNIIYGNKIFNSLTKLKMGEKLISMENIFVPYKFLENLDKCFYQKTTKRIFVLKEILKRTEDRISVITIEDYTPKMKLLNKYETLQKENIDLKEKVNYENSKINFLYTVSHDLKNPLNIILSSIQLLERKHRQDSEVEDLKYIYKYTKIIKRNCYRLVQLINNCLDINKIEGGFFEIFPQRYEVVSVIEDITMSVIEYAKSKNITLIFDTQVEELYSCIDANKMERVLLNLISNAVKHTDEDGYIYVNLYRNEKEFMVSVKDTGEGIKKELMDNIFDMYKQGNNEGGGTGIGLAVVRNIVEQHKGKITVESEYGKGSNFIMTLPIVDDEKSEKKVIKRHKNNELINIEFSDVTDIQVK